MDTRQILRDDADLLALSVSFNADNANFAAALESGFRVFKADSADSKLIREVGGGIGCAEMVGTTEYFALVGGGKQPKFPQNKVQIWNDKREIVSAALEFKTTVQRVRISRSHLVVVLLNNVGIYRLNMPPRKLKDYETMNNPFGLCELGEKIIAFPGTMPGQVKLFDMVAGQPSIMNAHESPLRALALNRKGDMIATASEKGTIIRVWSYPSCTKIAEFRRGVDPAAIFSLAFSPSSSMLAVTSDKSTLHIFEIAASPADSDPKLHKWGMLSRVPGLPRPFSDTYSSVSAKFEMGDDGWGPQSRSATLNAGIPGIPGGRPTKGLIAWLDEQNLVVVSAGSDARWEKFLVGVDSAGQRAVHRLNWKSYLKDR